MKINLSSTSFLLNDNKNWNFLSERKNILFSNYGEIFNFNGTKKDQKQIDVKIIFLSDIIENFSLKEKNNNFKKLKKILSIINKETKIQSHPSIICISCYQYINIIENSKEKNLINIFKEYFFNKLYKLSKKHHNLYLIDIDAIYSEHGIKSCFDKRNFYLSRCRLSHYGIEILAKNLKKLIHKIQTPNKKVLLLDCDNTLWGGVIAEDGINNIKVSNEGVGFAYYEFQKAIKKIKDLGVILVLISKNNLSDVLHVLKNKSSMVIKKEDIVSFKVNWQEKTKNIRELSKELNLGLNSFVFWDDNPIEREKIKVNLKDVEVFEPDADISNWPTQLLEYSGFAKFNITKADRKKTSDYKKRSKFIENKNKHSNEKNYLKSIKLKPKLTPLNGKNLDRAVQMCEKINQFNFSNKRYKHKNILDLKKDHQFYLISLKDIYGNHGIVGLVCLKIFKNRILLIDSFMMSCRVIGRHLENWILEKVKIIGRNKNIKNIVAEFQLTKRNSISKDFLIKNNFKYIDVGLIKKKFGIKLKEKGSRFMITDSEKKTKFMEIYEQKK